VFGALSDLQVNSLLVQANLIVNGQVQWGAPAVFNQPVTFQGAATFQGLATFQAGTTIAAPLTINLGSDAAYDLHYRSGGPLARLANGSSGQVLTASGSGPCGRRRRAAGGGRLFQAPVPITFLRPMLQAAIAGRKPVFVAGTGLGLGMTPQRALVSVEGWPVIQVDGSSSVRVAFIYQQCAAGFGNLNGCGGSNTGSNFVLRSAADNGTTTLINLASYRSGRTTVGNVYSDGYSSQLTGGFRRLRIYEVGEYAGTQVASSIIAVFCFDCQR
jgi:hypothetical protein